MSLIKFLAAALGLGAVLAFAPAAQAAEPAKAKTAAAKKTAAKPKAVSAKSKKAAAAAAAAAKEPDPEADEPDVAEATVDEFSCEMGNKVTIYRNAGDEGHIALRWKTRLHRLTQVATTTGAQRFENRLYGLIWIGIPSKGLLLDSKLNRQLANECRNAEQNKPAETPMQAQAPGQTTAPAAPVTGAPAQADARPVTK
ncbi:hypothetical protein IP91_02185 [Pseudoduganella lurida]|uniref:Lysozyme inhibitor n=1 Tax=Pseudoduganella lurida TaxID=1036180 RepID=A0A562RBC4_9BURK|nr:MliC family protein [Pseudoduganella lurida]TWI66372.1 hypothetical protein IP91_02185 [Pseudoduganella lurida]